MADFAAQPAVLPLHISTYSPYGVGHEVRSFANVGSGASQSWVANQAMYLPVSIPWPYPVRRVWWINGSTVAANKDMGIYTVGGTRIFSTGSTVESGASAVQYVTVGTPFILAPGRYYFAMSCSGSTNHAWGAAPGNTPMIWMGAVVQATSLPLPATMTAASDTSNGVLPQFGVTRTASGF